MEETLLQCEGGEDGLAVNRESRTTSSSAPARRATFWSTTINVFTLICYPYGVPYCFGQTGWYVGTVFLCFSTWINVEAGICLGEICSRRPELTSFPRVVDAAFGSRWGEARRRPRALRWDFLQGSRVGRDRPELRCVGTPDSYGARAGGTPGEGRGARGGGPRSRERRREPRPSESATQGVLPPFQAR